MNIKNEIRNISNVSKILNVEKINFIVYMPIGVYFLYSWVKYSRESGILSGIMSVMIMTFYRQQKITKSLSLLPIERIKLLNYMLVITYSAYLPFVVGFLLGYGDYSVKIIINYLSTLMFINLSLTPLNTIVKFIIMMCCIAFIKVGVGFIFTIPIGIGAYIYLWKNFLKE